MGIGRLSTLHKAEIAALIFNFEQKTRKQIKTLKFQRNYIISRSKRTNAYIPDTQTSGSSMIAGLTPTAYNGRML